MWPKEAGCRWLWCVWSLDGVTIGLRWQDNFLQSQYESGHLWSPPPPSCVCRASSNNQKKDVMKYTPHLKLINQRVWKFPEVISMINDTTKKLLETMKRKSKKWSLVWWWIILGQSSNILIYVDLRPTAKLIHLNWKNSKLQYFVKNSRKNLIYHFPDERIIEHPQAARWKKQSLTEKYLMDKEIELEFVKALPRHPSASVNI